MVTSAEQFPAGNIAGSFEETRAMRAKKSRTASAADVAHQENVLKQTSWDRAARIMEQWQIESWLLILQDEANAMAEERVRDSFEYLMRKLRVGVQSGLDVGARFHEKLGASSSMLSELRWADDVFDRLAQAEVWARVVLIIERVGPERAHEEAMNESVRMARSTSRSTSVCANLAEDGRRAAWAEAFSMLDSWRRH